MRSYVLKALPYPMQVVLGYIIHRNTVKNLHGQGTGRFTDEEIAEFREEIWRNIDNLLKLSKSKLGAKQKDVPFWLLGGSDPSEADMTLFGFIVSVLICTAYVQRSFSLLKILTAM
jgi:hypothetical protein